MFSEVTEAREVAREDKAGENDHEQALRDELQARVAERVQHVTQENERQRQHEAVLRVSGVGGVACWWGWGAFFYCPERPARWPCAVWPRYAT